MTCNIETEINTKPVFAPFITHFKEVFFLPGKFQFKIILFKTIKLILLLYSVHIFQNNLFQLIWHSNITQLNNGCGRSMNSVLQENIVTNDNDT